MMTLEITPGQTFHRLTVLHRGPPSRTGQTRWCCACSCGGVAPAVMPSALRSGNTKSCGCLSRECRIDRAKQKNTISPGDRFGRLCVLEESETRTNKQGRIFICQCDCGETSHVSAMLLKAGKTKSCGCLHRETVSQRQATHRMSGSPFYLAYQAAKGRCENVHGQDYADYGGRGIKFKFTSFEHFRDTMFEAYQEGLSLDRIEVNGDYCPENCRWATALMQANNKRTNVRLNYEGVSRTKSEWARFLGITPSQLNHRIKQMDSQAAIAFFLRGKE